jgi:RNA polymerase sigma factor for flagellar operon FliA
VQVRDAEQALRDLRPMVQHLAWRVKVRLPASFELDDLSQEGLLGVLQALKSFDAASGAEFRTHAWRRALGQIQDYIRRTDYLFRSDRAAVDVLLGVTADLEHQLFRSPSLTELSAALKWPVADVCRVKTLANANTDDGDESQAFTLSDAPPLPEETLQAKQELDEVRQKAKRLHPTQAKVLLLLLEGMEQDGVARELGVSASRFSQIKVAALRALGAAWRPPTQNRAQTPALGLKSEPTPLPALPTPALKRRRPAPRLIDRRTQQVVVDARRLLEHPATPASSHEALRALGELGCYKRAAAHLGHSEVSVRVKMCRARALAKAQDAAD